MRKKIIIGFAILIVIVAGVYTYLRTGASKDITPVVKTKIADIISKASKGLYKLETDSIHINIIKGEITLFNARLIVDSVVLEKLDSAKQAPNDVFSMSLKILNVKGISIGDLMDKKRIDLDNIEVDYPVINIFHEQRSYNYLSPDTADLYSRLGNETGRFFLKDLLVKDADLTYHDISANNAMTNLKNLSFHFTHILIDSTTRRDTARFLYAEKAFIILKNYTLNTKDSLYSFHFDSLALNAAANSMTVAGLSFKPRGNKNDFSKKITFYQDRYDLNIDTAFFQGVAWYNIVSGQSVNAKRIDLANGSLEVFADETLPDKPEKKVAYYPQQLLTRLPVPVSISKLMVNNFTIAYKELNAKSHKTGSVIFNRVHGTFTNITSNADSIAKNNFLVFTADSYFMNAGKLHSIFTFNLAKLKNGNFSVDAKMGEMNGTKLNTAVNALALVQIDNGYFNDFEFHMVADNHHSSGTVKFMYDSLKVTILQAGFEKDDPKKRALLTFLANSFILKKSNTADDKNTDVKQVSLQRDLHKSFFSLIWKTILQGITKTVKGLD